MGVMAGQMPTITSLRAGEMVIYKGGKVDKRFFITGGFADISEEK